MLLQMESVADLLIVGVHNTSLSTLSSSTSGSNFESDEDSDEELDENLTLEM